MVQLSVSKNKHKIVAKVVNESSIEWRMMHHNSLFLSSVVSGIISPLSGCFAHDSSNDEIIIMDE